MLPAICMWKRHLYILKWAFFIWHPFFPKVLRIYKPSPSTPKESIAEGRAWDLQGLPASLCTTPAPGQGALATLAVFISQENKALFLFWIFGTTLLSTWIFFSLGFCESRLISYLNTLFNHPLLRYIRLHAHCHGTPFLWPHRLPSSFLPQHSSLVCKHCVCPCI